MATQSFVAGWRYFVTTDFMSFSSGDQLDGAFFQDDTARNWHLGASITGPRNSVPGQFRLAISSATLVNPDQFRITISVGEHSATATNFRLVGSRLRGDFSGDELTALSDLITYITPANRRGDELTLLVEDFVPGWVTQSSGEGTVSARLTNGNLKVGQSAQAGTANADLPHGDIKVSQAATPATSSARLEIGDIEVDAATLAAEVESDVSASDRLVFNHTWAVSAASPGSAWNDIGVSQAADDVAIPSDLLLSDGSSNFDRVRIRDSQLRLEFAAGVGQFVPEFEQFGEIYFLSEGEVFAAIKNFGSSWNQNNNQYRIRTDDQFTVGTRESFRTKIETIGVAANVQILFAQAFAPIGVLARSEAGRASVDLPAGDVKIGASTDTPRVDVNVDRIPYIRTVHRSGTGRASADVLYEGNIGVSQASGLPTVFANVLKTTKLGISQSAGVATASAELAKPEIRVSQSAGTATTDAHLDIGDLSAEASAGTGRTSADLFYDTDLGVSQTAGAATASAELPRPEIQVSQSSDFAFDTIRLRGGNTISVEQATGAGETTAELRTGRLGLSAASEAATAAANVKDSTQIQVTQTTPAARVNINVEDQRAVVLAVRTPPASTSFQLAGQPVRFVKRTRRGRASVSLAGGNTLSASYSSGAGEVSSRLIAPDVSAEAFSLSATVSFEVEKQTDIKVSRQTRRGRKSVNLAAPDVEVSQSSGTGDHSVDVFKATSLSVTRRSQAANANAELFNPYILRVSQATGTARVSFNVEDQTKVAVNESAGVPSVSFALQIGDVAISQASQAGEVDTHLTGGLLSVSAASQAGQHSARLRVEPIEVSRRSRQGRTSINVQPGLPISFATAGTPTAEASLTGGTLSLTATAGTPSAGADLEYNVRVSVASGAGRTSVSLFRPTPVIRVTRSTGQGEIGFRLVEGVLSAMATAGAGSVSANIPTPFRPRNPSAERNAEVQSTPSQFMVDARTENWRVDTTR